MKKGLKIILIVLAVLFVLIIGVLIAVPKMIPNYVEENSQELLGRQVTLGEVHINYFKLRLEVTDFKLYEANGMDVFVSFDEYNVDLKLMPSLRGNYTISSMLLDNLDITVNFDGEHFNFDDMVVEADTSIVVDPVDTIPAEEVRFTLNNIELRGGELKYYDSKENIRHELSNIGFILPHFSWDNNASSEMDLTFKFEPKGVLKLKADIDSTKKHYKLTVQIIDLALAPFSAYLNSMLASQGIEGSLNNTIYVNGSMENPSDVVISGEAEVRDFVLKDEQGAPVFESSLLGVYLDSIDMLNSYYAISKVLVSEPKVYAELYDSTTNFDRLLKPMMDAAALADTVLQEEEDTTVTDSIYYQVDTFQLDGGAVYFTDNTLNRPFKYSLTAINTVVSGINPLATQVPVDYSLELNSVGELQGDAQFSMLNSDAIDYSGELKGLNLTSFSPYSEYYIARPINSGHFNFKGKATMTEAIFKSENLIHINDIELGAKTGDKPLVKLPVKLALGILKDKNGDVNIDIPMEGDPSDPEFNVRRLIGRTLTAFIVKIASAPFDIVSDIAGVDPERLKEIPLELTVGSLSQDEMETLDQIALALKEKPELKFLFTLEIPIAKEKEALAINGVKRNYLQAIATPQEFMDSISQVLSEKDTVLLSYVNATVDSTLDTGFGEKCSAIIGDEALDMELFALADERNRLLTSYLLDTLIVDPTCIGVQTMDVANHQVNIKKPRYRVEISVK